MNACGDDSSTPFHPCVDSEPIDDEGTCQYLAPATFRCVDDQRLCSHDVYRGGAANSCMPTPNLCFLDYVSYLDPFGSIVALGDATKPRGDTWNATLASVFCLPSLYTGDHPQMENIGLPGPARLVIESRASLHP